MTASAMQSSSSFRFNTVLKPGDTVAWPQGTGEPRGLTQRLVAERHTFPPIRLFIGMTASDTLSPECVDRFEMQGLNGVGTNRRLTAKGELDITPVHVSSVPKLLRSGAIQVDVALIRVRPTGVPGRYTLGVVADYTSALIQTARCVIAEVDERLPLTGHDAIVSADDIDVLVSADSDEILLADTDPSPVELAVARNVAAVIPDRATVQFGVGGLSVALARVLSNHRDLGVHSGLLSDVFVDLVEKGVVTNSHKGIDRGVSVTGCLFGTRRLNQHVSGNPKIALRSVEYTHNLSVMAQIRSLFSVNFAIEVDLTGQVNAEFAGGRYLGAVGGQVDFVRGAQLSPGGRAIIALPSTTADGKTSRIVASLDGRPVTTARSDIDMVVTEHGVADLRGASLSQRRKKLAAVAHPSFRDDLLGGTAVISLNLERRTVPDIVVSSPSPTVLVDARQTGAIEIWLNRPDRLNALSVETVAALQKVVDDAVAAGATALVFRGKGRGFCAGADLKERQFMAESERHAHNRGINAAVNAVAAAPVPTIAVINGIAMGGGLELALGCDIRIAAESAQLGLTEARIGAIPGAGGSQRLPRLIGVSRALDMMFSGEPIPAQKAMDIGLVNACVADEELDAFVARYMDVLASRSPSASRTLKKVVYEGMQSSLLGGLEIERRALRTILGSPDYAEGLAAFAEKRPPKFSRQV
jgi:acetyl-CoA hydrolase